MRRHVLVALGLALGVTVGATGTTTPAGAGDRHHGPQLSGALILGWNETMARAALASGITPTDPLHESRIYAMAHLAMHDALNTIDRRYEPYAMGGREVPDASPAAAVAVAAHDVLVVGVRASSRRSWVSTWRPRSTIVERGARIRRSGPSPSARRSSRAWRSAPPPRQMMIAVRAGDGSNVDPFVDRKYPQKPGPGQYRFIGADNDR